MRRPMVRLACLAALILGVAAVAQQPAGGKKEADDKKVEKNPDPGSLDDLIAQALRDNPDIRVAEAKLREADAELNRARMTVAQKVASLYHSLEIAKKTRDEAKIHYDDLLRLQRGAVVSAEEVRKARLAWELAINELAKLEAELPALLGKMPGKLGQAKAEGDPDQRVQTARLAAWMKALAQSSEEHTTRTALEWLAYRQALVAAPAPQGTIADKIRKALDVPVDVKVENAPLTEVLDFLADRLEGQLAFRVVDPQQGLTILKLTLNFKQMPAGAVLQAITDELPVVAFVVRDYGILVKESDKLPPGAVLLHDFWKSGVDKAKLKAEGSGSSETNNPPPKEVQGSIKAVDSTSGLVTITIGSDAGLAKGHTLHVYRTGTDKSNAMYLGTIRILEVRPSEAVGKPAGKLRDPIQAGDNVASKIHDK